MIVPGWATAGRRSAAGGWQEQPYWAYTGKVSGWEQIVKDTEVSYGRGQLEVTVLTPIHTHLQFILIQQWQTLDIGQWGDVWDYTWMNTKKYMKNGRDVTRWDSNLWPFVCDFCTIGTRPSGPHESDIRLYNTWVSCRRGLYLGTVSERCLVLHRRGHWLGIDSGRFWVIIGLFLWSQRLYLEKNMTRQAVRQNCYAEVFRRN